MSKASEKLAEIIGDGYGAQADFSSRSKIHKATLSRILQGKQRPNLEGAVKIEKHTRGKIKPKEWFDE